MTVAVSREGSSVYDLSDFIKNTMTPYVQRKGGVSSVSSSGLVEQLVQVQLNQEKVDAINENADGAYRHSAGSGAHTVGGGRGQDQGRPRRIR